MSKMKIISKMQEIRTISEKAKIAEKENKKHQVIAHYR